MIETVIIFFSIIAFIVFWYVIQKYTESPIRLVLLYAHKFLYIFVWTIQMFNITPIQNSLFLITYVFFSGSRIKQSFSYGVTLVKEYLL